MTNAAFRLMSIGFAWALLTPAGASSQSLHGEMGPQSRASVRISVSVAPRIRLERVGLSAKKTLADGPGLRTELFTIASNTAGFRYTFITALAADRERATEPRMRDAPPDEGARAQSAQRIVIVIPD
jgi:hypothetical protein